MKMMEGTKNVKENPSIENSEIIKKVIEFLQVLLPVTLAKRLVAIVLLAADVPVERVTELTGVCDRSTRGLRKAMRGEDAGSLLTIKRGSGKKSKTFGLETEILQEIEKNNYHTRQQIADMIAEKFHVSVSVTAVGRLLKKTASKSGKAVRFLPRPIQKSSVCFVKKYYNR